MAGSTADNDEEDGRVSTASTRYEQPAFLILNIALLPLLTVHTGWSQAAARSSLRASLAAGQILTRRTIVSAYKHPHAADCPHTRELCCSRCWPYT